MKGGMAGRRPAPRKDIRFFTQPLPYGHGSVWSCARRRVVVTISTFPCGQRTLVAFDSLKENRLAIFFYYSPVGGEPQQRRQGALRWDESGIEIVALHQDIPAVVAFQDLNVLLGHFLAEEITAAIHEDLLVWVEVKGEIVGPGVGREDPGTRYQIDVVVDG